MRLGKWLIYTLSTVVIVAGLLTWRNSYSGLAPAAEVSQSATVSPSIVPRQTLPVREPLPAPVEEAPLSDQIDRLIATHDPEKAYIAYRMLSDCAFFNKNHDRLTFDWAELRNRKPDSLPGYRGMTESEKLHDKKLCSAMTERQRLSRLDYLAIAAHAGTRGAAVAFAREGPFGDRTALSTRSGDPLVQEWRALAVAQLTSAAEEHGEMIAMHALLDEYRSGSYLTEKNPLLAYRYGAALGLIYRDIAGADSGISQMYAPESEMMNFFGSGMSPEERAAQFAEAKRIADNARALQKRAREKR